MGVNVSSNSASNAYAVTTSDTTEVAFSYLYVGTGGDVCVDMAGTGSAIVHKNVADGTYLWGNFKKIKATSTTASNIVGFR